MLPKYHELIHPVLELLAKEEHSRKSASEVLIDSNIFNLSEEEKNERVSNGLLRFEDRIGWAFTYLTKAEYIELTERKFIYRATSAGKEALKNASINNIVIDNKYLEENVANYYKNWQVKRKSDKTNEVEKDEDENNVTFDLEDELSRVDDEFNSDLLRTIKDMSWQDFEDLCANLLEKMGYGIASKRDIRTGDGGIDGEIFEDELGLKGKIYIQAKKWDNNNIQPKDMKEFLYNIRGNKGVFITTSDFSDKAKLEAANYKDGKVALINYIELIKLCKKYQVLCHKQSLEIYKLGETS
jgi:restriction system protein